MIKSGVTHPFLLASYRLLIAGFVLLPVFLKKVKKHKVHFNFSMLKQSLVAGIALGIHFLTWIIGARMSPAAHSTLIANLVPIAMPFFIFFMISERLNVYEITGTILALGGFVLLTFSDFSLKQ